MSLFNNQARGAGNGAERIVTGANGTISCPANRRILVTRLEGTYRGAGILRVRATDLAGAILWEQRYAADGSIVGGSNAPLVLSNLAGAVAANFVVTEEGAFINSLFMAGETKV